MKQELSAAGTAGWDRIGAGVVIGQVLYAKGGRCGPRVQPDYQLFLLHSGGSCSLHLDDRKYRIEAGRIYRLLPGHTELFIFSRERESHHSWCSIAPEAMPEEMSAPLAAGPFSVPASECYHRLVTAAWLLRGRNRSKSASVVRAIALALVAEFVNLAAVGGPEREPDIHVVRALDYMESHFADADCLAAAHRCAGLSRNCLIARFRVALGTTPARHLWRLRCEKGMAMLQQSGQTVSEIAEQCGFSTPFHFSRKVRELSGLSPRALRQRACRAWSRNHEHSQLR